MILVNTTFSIDSAEAEEFVRFLHDTYFPLASGAGMYNIVLSEMRERDEESSKGHRTFALQMRAPSQAILDTFAEDYLPEIYGFISRKWGRNAGLFETVLDVLHDSEKRSGND